MTANTTGAEDRADQDSDGQVADLGLALGCFMVFGGDRAGSVAGDEFVAGVGHGGLKLGGRDLVGVEVDGCPFGPEAHIHPINTTHFAEHGLDVDDTGRTRQAAHPELDLIGRHRLVSGRAHADSLCDFVVIGALPELWRVGWLDDELSVDHVHPTREVELSHLVGCELQHCAPECRQCLGGGEVGEHYPRRAVSRFLAIEVEPKWHTFGDADQIGRVATLHRDIDLLYSATDRGAAGLLRSEEEPPQESRQCNAGDDYEHLCDNHCGTSGLVVCYCRSRPHRQRTPRVTGHLGPSVPTGYNGAGWSLLDREPVEAR